jgi:zinc-ribbon domain
MNCKHCNAPLDQEAQFCPNCGAPMITQQEKLLPAEEELPTTQFQIPTQEKLFLSDQPATEIDLKILDIYNSVPAQRPAEPPAQPEQQEDTLLKTQPVPLKTIIHPELVEPGEYEIKDQPKKLSLLQAPGSLLYYKLNTTTKGSKMLPTVINTGSSRNTTGRRRRSKGGCALGCLTVLVLLLVVLGASWFFLLRPYLHNIAETQLDQALTTGIDQIPTSLTTLIPSGTTLPINEDSINNLIVLNLSPANPVQKPVTTITTQHVQLSFELYGYPSSIDLVPKLNSSGQLIADNVSVNGVFGLIMSSDEMTALLDKHFSDAQNKLGKTIRKVELTNQAIRLTLG